MQVTQSSEIGPTRALHSSVDWSSSQVLAVGSADAKARLYTVDGKEITAVTCSASVRKVRFSSDNNNILATSSMDAKVQLWDIRSSASSMTEITSTARSMEWNGTRLLAWTDRARQLHVYDTVASKPMLTVPDVGAECVFWFNDEYLVMGDDRGQLHVWNINHALPNNTSPAACHMIPAHSGGIYAGYARDELFVTGGADTTVLFWDAPTMTCTQSMGTNTQPRRTKYISSISGHQNRVAIAGPDPFVEVYQGTAPVGTIPTKPLEEVALRGPLLACVTLEPGPVTLHKLSFGS